MQKTESEQMIAARIRVAVGFGMGVAVGVTSGFFSSADMGSYPNVLFGVFCDFFINPLISTAFLPAS